MTTIFPGSTFRKEVDYLIEELLSRSGENWFQQQVKRVERVRNNSGFDAELLKIQDRPVISRGAAMITWDEIYENEISSNSAFLAFFFCFFGCKTEK